MLELFLIFNIAIVLFKIRIATGKFKLYFLRGISYIASPLYNLPGKID